MDEAKRINGAQHLADLPGEGPWKLLPHYDSNGNVGILCISPNSSPVILRDGKLSPIDFGAIPDDHPPF